MNRLPSAAFYVSLGDYATAQPASRKGIQVLDKKDCKDSSRLLIMPTAQKQSQPTLVALSQRWCDPYHCASVGAKSLQSCSTLCDPMDCSPPGSSVHGILQARMQMGHHFLLQGVFLTHGVNPHLTSPLASWFFTTRLHVTNAV